MRTAARTVITPERGQRRRWLDLLRGLRTAEPIAIIFDLDGVLANTMPCHIRAWRSALAAVGVVASDRDLYLREGEEPSRTARELFALGAGHEPSVKQLQDIVRKKNKFYAETVKVRLFPGARGLLSLLNGRGVRLGLVTGTVNLGNVFRTRPKFIEAFEVVVSGNDVSRSKPDPQPYELAVKRLQLSMEYCYAVENSPYGIASARGAGLACAAVRANSPFSTKYLLECGADHVYSSILQFGRHLEAPIADR